jgi:SSS family solute:Na+ symporter
MASPRGPDARRAAFLSGLLYLVWPLIMFFPLWAAPLLLPGMTDPSKAYIHMTKTFLPSGIIGLVLASLFAHTMAMTTSDANAITAVVTRDILPALSARFRDLASRSSLRAARITTLAFLIVTLTIGALVDPQKGILKLILEWFIALVGPTAVPMLFGMLPLFRRSGPFAAVSSLAVGVFAFAMIKFVVPDAPLVYAIGTPIFASAVTYTVAGLVNPRPPSKDVTELLDSLRG